MKCPGCDIEIADDRERDQVAHMELCHPEIIVNRWRANGISEEEIKGLLCEMERRQPSVEDLLSQCEEKGWDYFIQNMKEGRRGFYATVCYVQKPIHSFHHHTQATGLTIRSALALAMELARYDKGVRE